MSKKILIVEDYEDVRILMKFLLEAFNYQVIEAKDGLEAIHSFKHYLPDLVLMDISMPVMDGLAATREIRKIEGTESIPIIAVTAFGNQYHEQAIEAGCNALIKKPVDFDNLKPLLNQYLKD